MKKLPFVKMHGTGNDFIVLNEDDLNNINILFNEEFIKKMCNRNFGIGSDGILIVSKSDVADFKYNMYNPDGSKAEMCGNGIRCYMKYLIDNSITNKNNLNVETLIGVLNVSYKDKLFIVNMGAPGLISELKYETKKLGTRFAIKSEGRDFIFLPVSMGNPHAVIFLQGEFLSSFDLEKYGKSIENNTDIFSNRTNVEFIKVISDKEIDMRVWERGAGETLACGTGACASVVAGILSGRLSINKFIKVNLKGGILWVKWSGNEKDTVIMKGGAETTFEGDYFVND